MERTFSGEVQKLLRPDGVSVLGVTGPAGAGKSTHIAPLATALAEDCRFATAMLPFDAFFILSSRERKKWLEEGKAISVAEGARRADQMQWWDFGRAQEAIDTLRRGKPLHLTGVYNRRDGGELTGEVHIIPPSGGMLVVIEGVAICHLAGLDELMFTYAPAPVRLERLRVRDAHRQGAEILERFGITQTFEIPYFRQHWGRISLFVDNSVDGPLLMEALHHDYALSEEGLDLVCIE